MNRDPLPESKMPNVPPRILLGPGPSAANSRVLQAMMAPMIGYLDPDFLLIMDEVSELLKRVFQTEESMTMAVPGTGSAGMEAGLNSLLEPGDTVVICVYGYFGERMVEMAGRMGANVVPLRAEWARPFPAEMLEEELKKHDRVKLITAIHAETSVGVIQPIEGISRLAQDHDAMLLVDAVTSVGGTEVAVDRWNIDYCYTGTQKCLAIPPGLSPVALSPRAHQAIVDRNERPRSWYLDLELLWKYWGPERVYHHTAPVSMILGLREGLRMVLEEGLEERFARHRRNSSALRAGLEALGLRLAVPDGFRLDQITLVAIPDGIEDLQVRRTLLREHGIEIGGGLGQFAGKMWRVGLMGESSRPENVLVLLAALEEILPRLGYEVPRGGGVSPASKALDAA